jgi:hypothetical protein
MVLRVDSFCCVAWLESVRIWNLWIGSFSEEPFGPGREFGPGLTNWGHFEKSSSASFVDQVPHITRILVEEKRELGCRA